MFSKMMRMTLSAFVMASFVTGCGWTPGKGLKWGEDNPPTNSVRISLNKYACLRDFDKRVDEYINAKLSSRKINELATCLRAAIYKFRDNTKDLENGSYLPERLAKFLNDEYLNEERQITSDFLNEIMQVKRVVLGGSDKVITANELEGIVQIISLIENQAIKNLPYIPIYNQLNIKHKTEVSRQDLKEARLQLLSTARVVSDLFQSRNQLYSIDSLGRLILQAQKFLNWNEFHKDSLAHEQRMNLMRSYKEVVTGNRESALAPHEWQNLFRSAAAFYGFYLNYKFKFQNINFKYGPSYEVFHDTVNETFDLAGQWIQAAPKKIISFEATDRLFESLEKAGFLPINLTQKSVSAVYKQLVSRGLRPLSEAQSVSLGLGAIELAELKSEFLIWANTQSEVNNNIQKTLKINFSDIERISGETAKKMSSLDLAKIFSIAPFQIDMGMREISNLIQSIRPMFKVNDRRAYIMPEDELSASGVFNNIQNVSYINTMRSIVRMLIRSFATDVNVLNMAGVTEGDLSEFYKLIQPMGVELKFIDSRKSDGGNSFFTEANLFTFSGQGVTRQRNNENDLLTFNETVEFMAKLWSGGSIRDTLYNNILLKCRSDGVKDGPPDEFGVIKIDRACFTKHFFDNQFIEFSNLPYMMRFVQSLPHEMRDAFFGSLQDIAQIPCESTQHIENGEVATISTALHYVEVIFTVYDVDKDGLLNSQEIMSAFNRFYGYFDRMILETKKTVYDVSTIKSIFALLVKNQKLPGYLDSPTLYWYKLKYFDNNLNQVYKELPAIALDRYGLVRVLKVLSDMSSGSKRKSCPSGQIEFIGTDSIPYVGP